MRALIVALSLTSCATVNPYSYEELDSCPATMSEDQYRSGVIRCSAMCSSYARDFAEFDRECKCRCAPAAGSGGYRPQTPPKSKRDAHSNES